MFDKWWVWARWENGWRIDARFRTQAEAKRHLRWAKVHGSDNYPPGARVITRTQGGVPTHPDAVTVLEAT